MPAEEEDGNVVVPMQELSGWVRNGMGNGGRRDETELFNFLWYPSTHTADSNSEPSGKS